MRRLSLFFFTLLIFIAASIPAFAYEWPPPEYEMPRTLLTTESVSYALSGVKLSMGAAANIGLRIMGITASVILIGIIFNSFFRRDKG